MVKTVQVQEQATAQTITVNGQSVTVPALSGSSTPVWFTLNAQDGQTVTATGSITLRYGQVASTCVYVESSGPCTAGAGAPSPATWTTPQTFNASSSTASVSILIAPSSFGNVDPLPGVVKTVQVQEQATAQTITVNGQSVTVPAQSSSYACQLSGSPGSIGFSNTTVGYTLSYSAGLTSNCTTTVTIDSVQAPGSPFTISGFQTPFSLAAGQTQSYTAVFAPTATGTATGNIVFASTVSSVQPVTISLTGTGVASTLGTLSSNPAPLSFGTVAINSTQSLTATITNTGAASVTISGVSVAGAGFSLSSVTTPITLAVNQSVKLTVGFTPTSTSAASGTLTITSNASNGTFTVPLTGSGASHSVTLTWSESGGQIAGYNVYRSTVSGGPYSMINSSLVTPTNYTDGTVLSGTTYYYAVTAVGTSGMQSAYSSQTTATVP